MPEKKSYDFSTIYLKQGKRNITLQTPCQYFLAAVNPKTEKESGQ
jgi:hypothetical protein